MNLGANAVQQIHLILSKLSFRKDDNLKSYLIKLQISFVLFIISVLAILLINCETIDNIFISVLAGCFIELVVGRYEYYKVRKCELEKFLKEIIHSKNDFKPEMYELSEKDIKNISRMVDIVDKIIEIKTKCDIELLGDIYADSAFIFDNKNKCSLLCDMYYIHKQFYNDLYSLQCNLKRWKNSRNNNPQIPARYINEFYNKYVFSEKQVMKGYNIYRCIIDSQLKELHKMIYGDNKENIYQDGHHNYKHLVPFANLKQSEPIFISYHQKQGTMDEQCDQIYF